MLAAFPQYGLFPRWPEEGQGWIHPADVSLVTRFIPSERVMRRDAFDGAFYHYRYGKHRFRLRPCLWLPVAAEGVDVDDEVETIGINGQRELFVGSVAGMYYVRRKGRLLYRLRRGDYVLPKLFLREHLRLLSQKERVRPGEIEHPTPGWNGAGARMPVEP